MSKDSAVKTWFITGASRGFGREWTIAALDRGDRVAATARTIADLDGLRAKFGDAVLPLQLDVNDRTAAVEAVKAAYAHFGRLDVVVNNAGYGHFGFVEETTEEEARAQFDTNFFGALWVTQAALPYLREQEAGHIIQVSSVLGVTTAPTLGIYNASKWALEGLSESIAAEVAPFGIKLTLVEPGAFGTDWARSSATRSHAIDAYEPILRQLTEYQMSMPAAGDPKASAAAVLDVVDSENPPPRVIFGAGYLDDVEREYVARVENWKQWSHLSTIAQG